MLGICRGLAAAAVASAARPATGARMSGASPSRQASARPATAAKASGAAATGARGIGGRRAERAAKSVPLPKRLQELELELDPAVLRIIFLHERRGEKVAGPRRVVRGRRERERPAEAVGVGGAQPIPGEFGELEPSSGTIIDPLELRH